MTAKPRLIAYRKNQLHLGNDGKMGEQITKSFKTHVQYCKRIMQLAKGWNDTHSITIYQALQNTSNSIIYIEKGV